MASEVRIFRSSKCGVRSLRCADPPPGSQELGLHRLLLVRAVERGLVPKNPASPGLAPSVRSSGEGGFLVPLGVQRAGRCRGLHGRTRGHRARPPNTPEMGHFSNDFPAARPLLPPGVLPWRLWGGVSLTPCPPRAAPRLPTERTAPRLGARVSVVSRLLTSPGLHVSFAPSVLHGEVWPPGRSLPHCGSPRPCHRAWALPCWWTQG